MTTAGAYSTDDKVCLLPRLSLSELLYVSGLVRTVCSCEASTVMVLARRSEAHGMVRSLFGDIPNLRFHFADRWDELTVGDTPLLQHIEEQGYRLVPLPSYREVCPYSLVGLSPDIARAQFRVVRNAAAERALLDRVTGEVGLAYAVVHDDETRRIRDHLIPQGLPIVRVRDPRWRTGSPVDWALVIDNAVQFHGIDSCFLLLADLMALKARKFCHAYHDKITRAGVYHDVLMIWG